MTDMRTAVLLFALLVSVPAHADPDGSEVSAARELARFAKLVDAGDRARRAHQFSAAIVSYNDAFAIRPDPAVSGRIGLVLLEIGEYAAAAEQLLRAITKAQAPPYLMRQFHDGFARVRPKVCFVEVFVSEQDAEVLIDGEQEPESDHNAFHVFVTAGSHTFQAKRKGFEDATETIDIPARGELEVRLDLKPLPPPPPPLQEAPMPNPDPNPLIVGKPSIRLSDSYRHFYLGAGAVSVVGATPRGAFGLQISSGVRWKFFSIGADASTAWALATPELAPDLQLITWAITVKPCTHYVFLFGCGLVQVDGLDSLSENFTSQTKVGVGLRGGIEFVLRKPVQLQVWGEGVLHGTGYLVVRNDKDLWRGSAFMGGFGATAFLTF